MYTTNDFKQVDNNLVNLTQDDVDFLNANTLDPAVLIAESMRANRNALLAETDWWAVADHTMTAEQTAYRQALRDITTHENWPNLADSDWPTKP
jgi:hypothetical protein